MNKYKQLKSFIRSYKKVIVAFSGGIDSYLVLKATLDSLGPENTLAVTGDSPSLKETERTQTIALSQEIGAKQVFISTDEIDNPDYSSNPSNRCFFCKDELFSKLDAFRTDMKFDVILDGTNSDDLNEYRPGFKATEKHSVISPLAELQISKKEIRDIAKELKLKIWNKPSTPCLASRVPYGQDVTRQKLKQIEDAEEIINKYGFTDFRVRHFEFEQKLAEGITRKMKLAKIDITRTEIEKFFNSRILEHVDEKIKNLGYDYVTIDAGGLKSGSMNLFLENKEHSQNC
jgi:uncharacterized protein